MNVIYRTNVLLDEQSLKTDTYAKKISEYGGLENWMYSSFSKYLSEDANVNLSLFVDKNDVAEAKLKISDKGTRVYASAQDANKEFAVNTVINKCTTQLIKIKEKSMDRKPLMNPEDMMYFENLDENIVLDSDLINAFNITEAEQVLAEKKESPRYIRTMDKYVKHIYNISDIDNSIVKAENQLKMLYIIQESSKLTHEDWLLLTESIEQLKRDINALIEKKINTMSTGLNVRDRLYVLDSIKEEYALLKAKRR